MRRTTCYSRAGLDGSDHQTRINSLNNRSDEVITAIGVIKDCFAEIAEKINEFLS